MQCVNGHPNPDGNSFCGTCGAAAAVLTTPPGPNPMFQPGYAPQPGYTPHAPTGLVQVAGVGQVRVATFGQRLGARVIDLGILFASYVGISMVSFSLSEATDSYAWTPLLGLLWLVFWLLYEWLFIAYRGATIGKAALGILVIDQRNGARLGLGPAFVRQLIPVVGALFFFLGTLLVYVSPLFDNSGRLQGWHDKAANDLVIVKPN